METNDDGGREREMTSSRGLSLPRLAGYAGLCLVAVGLTVALLIHMFGGTILNSYGKRRLERAVARALPGSAVRIGKLEYAVGANRLIARAVTVSTASSAFEVGQVTLTGVRWARFLRGRAALAEVLDKAGLDATDLDLKLNKARYGIRCARLRASVPGSELIVTGGEFRPLVGDKELFAADAFRTTRYRALVPECTVTGLAYGELLGGKAYRARSIDISRPTLDVLVDRDKPVGPFVKRPLMVHEALAAIRRPLQVDHLTATGGSARYAERVVAGAAPGVLTFAGVSVSGLGIANRGGASSVMVLRARGELMGTGAMQVQMTFPVASPEFSFTYSGSLGPMDVTRLNAFLDIAEHTRIKSGSLKEAVFEVRVKAGQAHGRVRASYRDLSLAFLDTRTGSEKGFGNRVESFLANAFKIRNTNPPDASGSMKEGEVKYTRHPENEFLQFAWFALRTGVLDVISY